MADTTAYVCFGLFSTLAFLAVLMVIGCVAIAKLLNDFPDDDDGDWYQDDIPTEELSRYRDN